MRKIIGSIIILLILICICGCNTADTQSSGVTVNLPSDDSVNGYRISEPEVNLTDGMPDVIDDDNVSVGSNSSKKTKFYANTNSKIFHLKSCSSASKIDEEKLFITSDRDSLISQSYKPCKRCKP